MNEPHGGSEEQLRDVASALLNLALPERRAAISPLIAMIERVVAGDEPCGAGRGKVPDPAPGRFEGSTETPGN